MNMIYLHILLNISKHRSKQSDGLKLTQREAVSYVHISEATERNVTVC